MADVNQFNFTGRVGRDPSWKDGGKWQLSSFVVASDVGFGDRKKTQWISVTCFGKLADRASRYLKKGFKVFVSGEVTMREYTDREGVKKFNLDVKAEKFEIISQSLRGAAGGAAGADNDPFGGVAAPAQAETRELGDEPSQDADPGDPFGG